MGLESTEPHPSSSLINSQPGEKISEKSKSSSLSNGGTQLPSHNEYSNIQPVHTDGVGSLITTKLPFSGGSAAASMPQWHLDELLGFSDFNQSFSYMGNGSSKVCVRPIVFRVSSHYSGDFVNSPQSMPLF